MKIKVSYEDRYHPTELEVPDEECAVWVEEDYRQRLETAGNKSAVRRRTPQEIMDEEFNRKTFNSHQRETRRHVSLEAFDAYGRRNLGVPAEEPFSRREDYPELYEAIDRLRPQQRYLIYQIFSDWHHSLFATFSEDPHLALLQIPIPILQSEHFGLSHSRLV